MEGCKGLVGLKAVHGENGEWELQVMLVFH